jgi:hypothetical protein
MTMFVCRSMKMGTSMVEEARSLISTLRFQTVTMVTKNAEVSVEDAEAMATARVVAEGAEGSTAGAEEADMVGVAVTTTVVAALAVEDRHLNLMTTTFLPCRKMLHSFEGAEG